MDYETKIEFYTSRKRMQKGVAKMQKRGWEVVNTEVDPQGFSGCKTCLFGCLFLPLALLGRKPNHYKVTYRRAKE